jgi:hypothetical protein
MTVNTGDVIRCAVRQSAPYFGEMINVFHYEMQFASPQVDGDVTSALNTAIDNMYTFIEAYVHEGVVPVDIKFDVVDFVSGELEIVRNLGTFTWGYNYGPAADSDRLPPGTAALVKGLTTIGKVYGRKFLGGMVEPSQEAGVLSGPVLTALTNWATAYVAIASVSVGEDMYPGVMSNREKAFVRFVEADVSTNMAYQRRRRLGTGS